MIKALSLNFKTYSLMKYYWFIFLVTFLIKKVLDILVKCLKTLYIVADFS